LFFGFLGAALVAVWLARRRASLLGSAVASVAVVTFAYWALHGSIDWFWEFPGLAGPAFAWLGLAGGLERPAPVPVERPTGWTRRRMTAAALYTLTVVLALVSLTLPWLAAREVERAADAWRTSPENAYTILDRARMLNPLSARPDLLAGAIAMREDDFGRAEEAFERALDRHGSNWYAELELAVVAAQEGHRDEALRRLDRAEELNPLEETVDIVRDGVLSGEPVDPHVLDRIFLQRIEQRTS
jgi:tetratricopeptide (TPR) repeat protein